MRIPSVFFVGALLFAACNEPEMASPRQESLADGEVVTGHPEVVYVGRQRGDQGRACTGTFIAKNIILAARHCAIFTTSRQMVCPGGSNAATLNEAPSSDTNYFVLLGNPVSNSSADKRDAVAFLPEAGTLACGSDLALFVLEDELDVPVMTPELAQAPSVGDEIQVYGFGAFAAGVNPDFALRRTPWLPITSVSASPGVRVDGDIEVGNAKLCGGDSGGPGFGRDGRILGVTSRTVMDCAGAGVLNGLTQYRDWILNTVKRETSARGFATPAWVREYENIPDAGSDAALRDASSNDSSTNDAGSREDASMVGDASVTPLPSVQTSSGCSFQATSSGPKSLILALLALLLGMARTRISMQKIEKTKLAHLK